jgi:hypothetical protein
VVRIHWRVVRIHWRVRRSRRRSAAESCTGASPFGVVVEFGGGVAPLAAGGLVGVEREALGGVTPEAASPAVEGGVVHFEDAGRLSFAEGALGAGGGVARRVFLQEPRSNWSTARAVKTSSSYREHGETGEKRTVSSSRSYSRSRSLSLILIPILLAILLTVPYPHPDVSPDLRHP